MIELTLEFVSVRFSVSVRVSVSIVSARISVNARVTDRFLNSARIRVRG